MSIKNTARSLALFAGITIATAHAAPYDIPAAVDATAKRQITAGSLAAPIRYLADDLLEGRGPATRGDSLARLYLATELESLGYKPAGTKKYQQEFDVVGTTAQLRSEERRV